MTTKLKFMFNGRYDWRCKVSGREYCIRGLSARGPWEALCNGLVLVKGVFPFKTRADATTACQAHHDFLDARDRYITATDPRRFQ